MILKYILLFTFVSSYLFAVINPYENLDSNEKINVMVNYFLNEELTKLKPEKPIKEKIKDDDTNTNPIKFESYFSYIERLKAIRESRITEQKKIDEKYEEQIAFYNSKLKKLQRFYNDKKNLKPILQRSINKAFKVIYGDPKITHIQYNKNNNAFVGQLVAENIYYIDNFPPKNIYFSLLKSNLDTFFTRYNKAKVDVVFDYSNNLLTFKSIQFRHNNNLYKGIFKNNKDKNIKLNIKINDDIFRLEKI